MLKNASIVPYWHKSSQEYTPIKELTETRENRNEKRHFSYQKTIKSL